MGRKFGGREIRVNIRLMLIQVNGNACVKTEEDMLTLHLIYNAALPIFLILALRRVRAERRLRRWRRIIFIYAVTTGAATGTATASGSD
jgi:hypothetical protein